MEKAINHIELKDIIFTSSDTEVMVKGNILRGHMSYETELYITHTQLNMVMNQLRSKNENFSTEHILKSEQIDTYEILYYSDLTMLSNTLVDFGSILQGETIFRISA